MIQEDRQNPGDAASGRDVQPHMASILAYLRSFRRPVDTPADDGELLRRFRLDRDEQAFAALVQRHGGLVLGGARRLLDEEQLAEDVFQAVFLVLARRGKQLENWPSVAGWLVQVTRRTALQALAKTARRRRHELQRAALPHPDSLPDACQSVQLRELAASLDLELAQLPQHYRTPLILCHLQGRTKEEAARQLGWPVGSVSGRLARAKKMLKARLLHRGFAPSLVAGALLTPRLDAQLPTLLVQATTLLASNFAHHAAPSASATAVGLAQGVITSMFLTKLKWSAAVVLVSLLCLSGGVWAWSSTGHAVSLQGTKETVETREGSLLDKLQGVWVVEESETGRPVPGDKWWEFRGNRLHRAPGIRMLYQLSWEIRLDESATPVQIDLNSSPRVKGILKLENGQLTLHFANPPNEGIRPRDFQPTAHANLIHLRRATDYDRLEGIWRKETHNPVTNELDSAEEIIFRKNLYVRRYFGIGARTPRSDRFIRETRPARFELYPWTKPKGIDWEIVKISEQEEPLSSILNDPNPEMQKLNLTTINLRERYLGIYELSATEFRLDQGGFVPLEVKEKHLVPNPNAPSARRPNSFAGAGDQVKAYRRVDRSLKDQLAAPLGASDQPPVVTPESPSSSAAAQPSKLQDLLQQRLQLAQERWQLANQAIAVGSMSKEQLAPIAEKLAEAKMAVATTKDQKIRALEEHLSFLKKLAEGMDDKYKAGGVTRADVLAFKLRVLELEIQLEEFKTRP
jgi:RNA polymerase sigma factor (sigma-70 family)